MQANPYIIAGASSGIGFSLAQQLISEGHQVVGLSRIPGPLAGESGYTHLSWDAIQEDVPELPSIAAGLVYAPGSILLKPFGRLTEADFIEHFRLNVTGAVSLLQKAYPALRKGNASVVLFSTVAVKTGMPYHSLISSVKGSIEGLVKALAAEWAPHIRVNAVAPSLTATALAGRLTDTDEKIKASAERHPLKRIGQPQDIAAAVRFLLSSQSGWITGQILPVDGGISAIRNI